MASLPLTANFATLLPDDQVSTGAALPPGITIGCDGDAGVSLALAVAAGPSQRGSWVAVAGFADIGVVAAIEHGLALQRLVAVPSPGTGQWADVMAAMIDGFDLIIVGSGVRQLGASNARRLQARAQAKGASMVIAAGHTGFGFDMQLTGTSTWHGLGNGHGVAQQRDVRAQLHGRRVPRARCDILHFPVVAPVVLAPVVAVPVVALPAPTRPIEVAVAS